MDISNLNIGEVISAVKTPIALVTLFTVLFFIIVYNANILSGISLWVKNAIALLLTGGMMSVVGVIVIFPIVERVHAAGSLEHNHPGIDESIIESAKAAVKDLPKQQGVPSDLYDSAINELNEGKTDSAEKIYRAIASNENLPPDERAKAKLNLAALEAIRSPEAAIKTYQDAATLSPKLKDSEVKSRLNVLETTLNKDALKATQPGVDGISVAAPDSPVPQ